MDSVRTRYPNGIFKIDFGKNFNETEIAKSMTDILLSLGYQPPPFSNPDSLKPDFIAGLQHCRCLIIADDVWDSEHIRYLRYAGHACTILVTSQRELYFELPDDEQYKLNLNPEDANLDKDTALKIIKSNLDIGTELDAQFLRLIELLGGLPILLSSINGQLVSRPANMSISELVDELIEGYEKEGPESLSDKVSLAIRASIKAIQQQEYADLYRQLAIFATSAVVPMSLAETYWKKSRSSAKRVWADLSKRSLLNVELTSETFRLHEVFHKYLENEQRASLEERHKDFLEAVSAGRALTDSSIAEPYWWTWLTFHLKCAKMHNSIPEVVRSLRYIVRKSFYLRSAMQVIDELETVAKSAANGQDDTNSFLEVLVHPSLSGLLVRSTTVEMAEHTLCAYLSQVDSMSVAASSFAAGFDKPHLKPVNGLLQFRTLINWNNKNMLLSDEDGEIESEHQTSTPAHIDIAVTSPGFECRLAADLGNIQECVVNEDGTEVSYIVRSQTDDNKESSVLGLLQLEPTRIHQMSEDMLPDGVIHSFLRRGNVIIVDRDGKPQQFLTTIAEEDLSDINELAYFDEPPRQINMGAAVPAPDAYPPSPVTVLAVAREHGSMAAGTEAGKVHYWARGLDSTSRILFETEHRITLLTLNESGTTAVIGAANSTLTVVDVETREQDNVFSDVGFEVSAAAIDRSGTVIVYAVASTLDSVSQLWLWDRDPDIRIQLPGHTGRITGCTLSADASRIFSISSDQTIRVWGRDGREITALAITEYPRVCSCSRDGRTLAVGGEEGLLLLTLVE
jgi:hypothetical protein